MAKLRRKGYMPPFYKQIGGLRWRFRDAYVYKKDANKEAALAKRDGFRVRVMPIVGYPEINYAVYVYNKRWGKR